MRFRNRKSLIQHGVFGLCLVILPLVVGVALGYCPYESSDPCCDVGCAGPGEYQIDDEEGHQTVSQGGPVRWCCNRDGVRRPGGGGGEGGGEEGGGEDDDDDGDCPEDGGGASPMSSVGGAGRSVFNKAARSYPGSYVDNISLNYHHYVNDYRFGGASSSCGSCSASQKPGAGLSALRIQRRHRYRDLDKSGSFGPGVFCNYDVKIFFYEEGFGIRVELFDPKQDWTCYLVDGLQGDPRDGLFHDVRNKGISSGQLLDVAGQQTVSLDEAETFLVTGHNGHQYRFQVINLGTTAPADHVSCWKFNGSSVDDRNVRNGVDNGDIDWVPGRSGEDGDSAIYFHGKVDESEPPQEDSFVEVANLSNVLGGTSSMSFWIQTTQTGGYWPWDSPGITGVEEAGGGNDIFWGWIDLNGRIRINSGGSADAYSLHPVNDGAWHHVVMIRNAETGRVSIYVDGLFNIGTNGYLKGAISNAFSSLGRIEDTAGTHEHFQGALDDLRIYDRELTFTEIGNLSGQFPRRTAGRLVAIQDRNGYGTSLTYRYQVGDDPEKDQAINADPTLQWQVETVVDAHDRQATFHYRDTHMAGAWVVDQIDLPSGQSIQYFYEDDLRLTRVLHPDQTESTFTYSQNPVSQTTEIGFQDSSARSTSRNKKVWLTNSFVVWGANKSTNQLWNQSSMLVRMVANGEEEVTYLVKNTTGNPNVMAIYEGTGKLKQIDGEWEARYYELDWSFDANQGGAVTGTLEPTYSFLAQHGYWPSFGQQATYPRVRDDTGRTYSYQYDTDTFPTQKSFPFDNTTEVTQYNDFKQVTRYEDRLNRVTKYTYDEQGNQLTREVGLLNIGTDAAPNDVPQPEHAIYTKTYYPEDSPHKFLLQSEIDPNGNVTEYFYNDKRLVKEIKRPDDTGTGFHVAQSFTYDGAGRLATSTDAMGRVTTYTYDARDRTIQIAYNDGSTEETLYGAPESGDPEPVDLSIGDANLVVARKDRNGNVSTMDYDNQGRLIRSVTAHDNVGSSGSILSDYTIPSELLPDSAVTTCSYLDGTNLRHVCTTRGETTTYGYDYRHRLVMTLVQPREGTKLASFSRYLDNQLFSRTDPYGRKTFYAYRASDGALLRTVQATVPNPENEPTTFEAVFAMVRSGTPDTPAGNSQYLINDVVLDQAGQQIARIDPRSIVHATAYDSRGRTVLSAEAAATLPPYNQGIFDPTDDGQLQEITAKTVTRYDANSNVVEVQHPRFFDSNDTTGFEKCNTTSTYSQRNLLLSRTVADGAPDYVEGDADAVQVTESFTYYNDGRRKTHTDFRGNVSQTLWHQCCGRPQGSVDPTGQGTLSNNDFYGNVTHTATVKDLNSILDTNGNGLTIVSGAANTGAHNPPNAETLGETTSRYDNRNRLIARTVWLAPLDEVVPNDPPIAGDGANDDSEPEGLTTFYGYDEDLTTDNTVILASGTPVSLDGLIAKLKADSGLSIFFTAGSDGTATVTENPEGELSVSLQDGRGRTVASGILAKDAENTPVTWSTVQHDTLVAVADFGDCLETTHTDALGRITKTRTDAAGRTLESQDAEGNLSTMVYDGNGNVLISRDANGVGQDCVYDLRNRRTQCTDTAGSITKTVYDKHNNVVSKTDAKDQIDTCQFDARDRRTHCTDRIDAVTQWRYDPNGNLLSLTDGENQATSYVYDARNLQIQTTYPDHVPGSVAGDPGYGITLCSFDASRRRSQCTDQLGDTVDYAYDLANRLLSRTYTRNPAGPDTGTDTDSFTYDNASRMLTAVSGRYNNTITYTYDNAGRKSSESLTISGQTYTTQLSYDDASQLVGYTYPEGSKETGAGGAYMHGFTVSRSYTQRGQLSDISILGGAPRETRTYDSGGRLASISNWRGVTETRAYNNDNTLASITFGGTGSALGSYSYTWDENKNKTSETITGVMSAYGFGVGGNGYDAEDRLVNWERTDGNRNQSWNLSLVGDWTNFTENGTDESRTHGPAHEIQAIGGIHVQHDAKGNQTVSRTGQSMIWDQDNKLFSVDIDGDGTPEVTQTFDALGRRVSRTDSNGAMVFVQVGQQTLADYAAGAAPTNPTHRYVYASYVDEPVIRYGAPGAGEEVFFHRTQQYSVVGLTGKSGEVLERYAYTAYGKPTILAANGLTELDNSAYANRYLYTGREWDPKLALYHYRARMYDPADGRFISRDPLQYIDGMSLYAAFFVPGSTDPNGLTVGGGDPWAPHSPSSPVPANPNPYPPSPPPSPDFIDHYFSGNGKGVDISGTGLLSRWRSAVDANPNSGMQGLKLSAYSSAYRKHAGKCGSSTQIGTMQRGISAGGRGIPDAVMDDMYIINDSTIKLKYSCTVNVACQECCDKETGQTVSRPLTTKINCNFSFTLNDRFANPLDWHTPTPILGPRGDRPYSYESEPGFRNCLRACLRIWPLDLEGCRRKCRRAWPNTELPGGKPYDITGTWSESFSKTIEHHRCK